MNDLFTKVTIETVSKYFRQQPFAGNTDFTFTQTSIYPPAYDRHFCLLAESRVTLKNIWRRKTRKWLEAYLYYNEHRINEEVRGIM